MAIGREVKRVAKEEGDSEVKRGVIEMSRRLRWWVGSRREGDEEKKEVRRRRGGDMQG